MVPEVVESEVFYLGAFHQPLPRAVDVVQTLAVDGGGED